MSNQFWNNHPETKVIMKNKIFVLDPELQEITENLTPNEMRELAAEFERLAKSLEDVANPIPEVLSPRIRKILEAKFLRTALSSVKRANWN
jgi:hypothetical protein